MFQAKAFQKLKLALNFTLKFSEKLLKIFCQQKITNHIRFFVINQITKAFKVNITVSLYHHSRSLADTSPFYKVELDQLSPI